MRYVFNKNTGKGFVIITGPEELMLYVKHPMHIEDAKDLAEARECQQILNKLSMEAINSYIGKTGRKPPEQVFKDYEERAIWSQDFIQYPSHTENANPPFCTLLSLEEPQSDEDP